MANLLSRESCGEDFGPDEYFGGENVPLQRQEGIKDGPECN